MDPLLLIAAALLFLGAMVAFATLFAASKERHGVARSVAAIQAIDSAPTELKSEIERPFAERVIAPLGDRAVDLGRKVVRADTAKKLQYRLNVAGNPPAWDVNRLIGLKVLGLGIFAVGSFFYTALTLQWPMSQVVLATGLMACFGYLLPNLLLYNAGQKRETQIRNGLPDAIDLLTVSVEAGLGFDAAVDRVARNTEGPIAMEFARLLQEMQLGLGRVEAMRAMSERSTLDDFKAFCNALVQADSLGIPLGRVLRVQSREMRTKRRQRAEEKAQQVPVRMMIPLVLFILPCLFIVILGPAGIQIVEIFGDS